MPTNLQTMIGSTAERAVARGVQEAVDDTIGGFFRPGIPERIGFVVGLTILGVGLSVRARRRKLERIEEKVDVLVTEEVLADDAPQLEDGPEPEIGVAAAREGRRERRLARRRAEVAA